MTVLTLQSGIIYGPINSRRLGRSLGINLLPTEYKLCSFDCVYCHYGRTKVKTLFPDEGLFPESEAVLEAVEQALRADQEIDYITFSGNGEPTLHPHFAPLAAAVRELRDVLRPTAKLALLSNSTTVHRPHIGECLSLFDAAIMKLDAGDPQALARINRPAAEIQFRSIVEGLKAIPGLIVQSVLLDGKATNVQGEAYASWMNALAQVRPARVQIYSTDRPVADAGVEKVPPDKLEQIAQEIEQRLGLPVEAYWPRRREW